MNNRIDQFLLGSKDKIQRDSIVWNIIASVLNASLVIIYTFLISFIMNETSSGIFSLAYSNAMLFATIGYYGVRVFQATDLKKKYDFLTYLFTRIITGLFMILICISFIIIKGYTGTKAIMVFLLSIYKLLDVLEDVLNGHLQLCGRLDIAMKAMSIRLSSVILIFAIILIIYHDLIFATIASIIISIIILLFIINRTSSYFNVISLKLKWNKVLSLVKDCFPIFLGNFLYLYIINAPKYAIDDFLTLEEQAYYAYIYMPSNVINLFSGIIIYPMLLVLATYWLKKQYIQLKKHLKKILLWIIVITIFVESIAAILGIPILSFVFSTNLTAYKVPFLILLFGGGCTAIVSLTINTLTVIRKQNIIVEGYFICAVLNSILSKYIVLKYNIKGAAIMYTISMLLLSMGFYIYLILKLKDKS